MAAVSVRRACALLGRSFPERRLFHAPQPLTLRDKWLAVLATILNAAVSVAGWLLWKAGWITITFPRLGANLPHLTQRCSSS